MQLMMIQCEIDFDSNRRRYDAEGRRREMEDM
jgi:hypothetical protein